jgi:4-carboxymuconolactone decarboxylase
MASERFRSLADEEMTPDQKRVAEALRNGPRRGLPGPFHALLRSPALADRVRQLGDYIRFENSLPASLRELAILVVARFWRAQYEWHQHRKIAIEAGLDPAIPDAIAEGRRPAGLSADQALVHDFCRELLDHKDVSDATYEAALARFGERGVLDLICTLGYFGFVSAILNAKRHSTPDGKTPLRPLGPSHG